MNQSLSKNWNILSVAATERFHIVLIRDIKKNNENRIIEKKKYIPYVKNKIINKTNNEKTAILIIIFNLNCNI